VSWLTEQSSPSSELGNAGSEVNEFHTQAKPVRVAGRVGNVVSWLCPQSNESNVGGKAGSADK
jgi:hypothetical protein